MTIHLSGHGEQRILSLLQGGRFASPDEVIDEALRLIEARDQEPGEAEEPAERTNGQLSGDRTAQPLGALTKLCQKLSSMPTVGIGDGLSNRDHDRILYAKRP